MIEKDIFVIGVVEYQLNREENYSPIISPTFRKYLLSFQKN